MFSEKVFRKNEKEKEENEDENVQLIYYLPFLLKVLSMGSPILYHYKYVGDSPLE